MSEKNMLKTKPKIDLIEFLEKFGVLIFLILLIAFFQFQNDAFLSKRNIFNILNEVSIYGVMAIGMTMVILTAGIDLSVGSVLAFTAIFAAYIIKDGNFITVVSDAWYGQYSWLLGIGICLLLGTLIGYLQGLGITKLKIPPFIVTLGGMTIWRGATLIVNNGSPIAGFDEGYRWWGRGFLLGIPVPVIIFAVVVIIGYVALHKTKWGRYVYAVGSNPASARLAGVNINKILISVYVVTGALAGLAGFMLSARLGSAESIAGVSFELRVIASVVIGGTSLMGGYGKIFGTVIGSILLGVLINGLVLMDISPYYQQIIMGLIIILAVAFDTYAKNRRGV